MDHDDHDDERRTNSFENLSRVSAQRHIGAPVIDPLIIETYLEDYKTWSSEKRSHPPGTAETMENFDEEMLKVLNLYHDNMFYEESADKIRQELANALYLGGFEDQDELSHLVGPKVRAREFKDTVVGHMAELDKEVQNLEKEFRDLLKEIKADPTMQGRNADCDIELDDLLLTNEKFEKTVSLTADKKADEVNRLVDEYRTLSQTSVKYGELKLQRNALQMDLNARVPSVHGLGAWLWKSNHILRHIEMAQQSNQDIEIDFTRRVELPGTDEFWGPLDAPWDPKPKRKARLKQSVNNTSNVGGDDPDEIFRAELTQPILLSFGDERAMRPKYFPATGSQGLAVETAIQGLGVDFEKGFIDGNVIFFDGNPRMGIKPGDCTRMEVLRKVFLEHFGVDGGEELPFEDGLNEMVVPNDEDGVSQLQNEVAMFEGIKFRSMREYGVEWEDTFLFEKEDDGVFTNPQYLEMHEVWFGNTLHPPSQEKIDGNVIRFVLYSVRKRSKHNKKQSLLWLGILCYRKDDVEVIMDMARKKHYKNHYKSTIACDQADYTLKRLIGKQMHRRVADAFIRCDDDRNGHLDYQELLNVMNKPRDQGGLGIYLSDSARRRLFRKHDVTKDSTLNYEQYEALAFEAVEKAEQEGGASEYIEKFPAEKKQEMIDKRGEEIVKVFNRFDIDGSGELEVAEIWSVLYEFGFDDLDKETISDLLRKYGEDDENHFALNQDEFVNMAVDALLIKELDRSITAFMWENVFGLEPLLRGGIEQDLDSPRAAIYFERDFPSYIFNPSNSNNRCKDAIATLHYKEMLFVDGFQDLLPREQTDNCLDNFGGNYYVSKDLMDLSKDGSFQIEIIKKLFVQHFVKAHQHELEEDKDRTLLECITEALTPEKVRDQIVTFDQITKQNVRERRRPLSKFAILEEMDGNPLWEDANVTLRDIELVDLDELDLEILPTARSSVRFVIYTCRDKLQPTEDSRRSPSPAPSQSAAEETDDEGEPLLEEPDPIRWILIVCNDKKDIRDLKNHTSGSDATTTLYGDGVARGPTDGRL